MMIIITAMILAGLYAPLGVALIVRRAGLIACDSTQGELSWWGGYGLTPRWARRLSELGTPIWPEPGSSKRWSQVYQRANLMLGFLARTARLGAGGRTNTLRWRVVWAATWPAGVTLWVIERFAAERIRWAN